MLDLVGVLGQPKPGCLHCVECVGILQSKRTHRRGDEPAVSVHNFLPGGRVPSPARSSRSAPIGEAVVIVIAGS